MQPIYHIGAYSGWWVVLSCRQILMSSYGDRINTIKSGIRLYSLYRIYARFNASLLTPVSLLYVMKAPAAGRMTREKNSKHMWFVIWWKGFAENQGNLTSGINISAVLSSHLCSIEEKMETGILDRDWGFARHERKRHCSITDRWFQNQRHEIALMCVFVCTPKIQKWKEAAGNRRADKCLIIFEL